MESDEIAVPLAHIDCTNKGFAFFAHTPWSHLMVFIACLQQVREA
jgi:hypothetical protein